MNLLISIFGILILGFVGLALLRVAKNIAYLLFVLMIGWTVWVFLAPKLSPHIGNIPTNPTEFNNAFADAATKDIDNNTKTAGDRIAQSVVGDIDALMDEVERKNAARSAQLSQSGSVLSDGVSRNPFERLKSVFDRVIAKIFGA